MLKNDEDPRCQDRLADVLVIPHLTSARRLPDGSRAIRTERVCLDFTVVNALGQGHWSQTALGGGQAAEAYDLTKRQRKNVEQRCTDAGLRFWPVVFEHQGGMSKAADSAARAVAKAVAIQERRDEHTVRNEMLQRISVILARSNPFRIWRRRQRRTMGHPLWAAAGAQAQLLQYEDWQ